MVSRLAVAAALVLSSVSPSAFAQPPTAHDKTQDARLDALEKQVGALKGNVDALTENIREQSAQIGILKNDTRTLTDQIVSESKERSAQIDKLRKELTDLAGSQKDTIDQHQKILDEIARHDGRRHVPNLTTAMDESQVFRQQMDDAVHRSLKTMGKFHIVNKTNSHQWIWVNRREEFLRPGEPITIDVPVGTVTTQLPGQGIVNWTLAHTGKGEYSESIEIVPSHTPARRIVGAPMYMETPVYIRLPPYSRPTSTTLSMMSVEQ
jgi:hypothetical protein